jgi:hypothetical protein
MSPNTSKYDSDSIINNTIKIIYRGDNGKTIKNAILSKSQCSNYAELELKKTKRNSISNKTLKNNSKIYNSKQNSNIEDITVKCFTKTKKIKSQPKIIISDITDKDKNQDNNKKYSYLVVMMSTIITSFENESHNTTPNTTPNTTTNTQPTQKYVNWVAIINDNKVDKNIIKYSLNKQNGLYNFIIRIYKFPKNNINVINHINTIINKKFNKIIKNLKKVNTLERIYTNNIIVINQKSHTRHWWGFESTNVGIKLLFSILR